MSTSFSLILPEMGARMYAKSRLSYALRKTAFALSSAAFAESISQLRVSRTSCETTSAAKSSLRALGSCRRVLREPRLCRRKFCFECARVDYEKQVSLFDELPLLEIHLFKIAADARPDFYRLHGGKPRGVFVDKRDIPFERDGRDDFGELFGFRVFGWIRTAVDKQYARCERGGRYDIFQIL